ncbi:MAG: DUF2244 domain-containing protein [Notoacmeibacter sp.]|nr:DUF2244 domain-containing protein [Notoacmeibacter sp.]
MSGHRSVSISPSGPDAFHAVIRPHQSLSDAAFEGWVLGFIAFAILSSVIANMAGAGPVGFFMGLDGMLIAGMFVAWRAHQDRREEIMVEAGNLTLRRYRKERLVEQRRFPASRLVLSRNDDPDYGCLKLQIGRQDRFFPIACDLSPHERTAFAEALCSALRQQGRGPVLRKTLSHALAA